MQRVWARLQTIPYGETTTYKELAHELNSGPRAVGRANGLNPISIIVPCHRVLGTDGSLTGYGGGLEIKRALLDLERR
jgi:methylated-DNA-[protein]-cysteine S-methyltransferase